MPRLPVPLPSVITSRESAQHRQRAADDPQTLQLNRRSNTQSPSSGVIAGAFLGSTIGVLFLILLLVFYVQPRRVPPPTSRRKHTRSHTRTTTHIYWTENELRPIIQLAEPLPQTPTTRLELQVPAPIIPGSTVRRAQNGALYEVRPAIHEIPLDSPLSSLSPSPPDTNAT